MKKYIVAIILIFTVVLSCEDFLEIDSANQRAISSVEDVKGVLGGYLLTVTSPDYHMNSADNPYQYTWYREVDFMLTAELAQMFAFYENSFNVNDYLQRYYYVSNEEKYLKGMNWRLKEVHEKVWKDGYLSIGLMNNVINELAILGDESSDEAMKVKGEAQVIRAWNALKLLQYFAPFNDNSMGIPLNFDAEETATVSGGRLEQTTVFNMIINDLTEALSYEVAPEAEYNVFFSKNVINAVLAQTYMYKATGPASEADDWDKARTHAQAAMQGKNLAMTGEALNSMFKSDEKGAIFDNPHSLVVFFWEGRGGTDMILHWGWPQYAYGWGWPAGAGVRLSPELEAIYNTGDNRLGNGVYTYDLDHNEFSKYAQSSFSGPRNICPMFRMADMQLIVAESYARTGDDGSARQWLDEFKTSRNAGAYSSSDVLQEILNERKKEFFMEFDYTWLDMKRNQTSLTRTYVDPQEGELTVTLEANDFRYAFYIPIDSELSVNPNLEQNPGWTTD